MSLYPALMYFGEEVVSFSEFGSETRHETTGSISHFFAAAATPVLFDVLRDQL